MTRSLTCVALLVWSVGSSAAALAETTKTTVKGWTGTGQEIVLEVEQFGEVMIDDTAQDYWFATIRMLRASNGQLIQTYRRPNPTGAAAAIPAWTEAKPSAQVDKFLENAGLVEAIETDRAPSGAREIVTISRHQTAQSERGYQCSTDARVLVLDGASQEVWVAAETTKVGEFVDSPGAVVCPSVGFRTWWHPDSTRWLVELTSNGEVTWLPGSATQADNYANAPFTPADFSRRVLLKGLPDGPVRSSWIKAFEGDLRGALQTLVADTSGSVDKVLIMALLLALDGDTKASKSAAKQAVKIARTPWTEGVLGAVYMAAGDTKRAQKMLAGVTKRADDYSDLAKVAAVLSLVDLELSNQVYIHALSHPSAAQGDTLLIYAALLQGLIEVGENDAAQELLGKVARDSGLFKLLEARLALSTGDTRRAKAIVDDVMFTEPGRCMVFGTNARLSALESDTAEALESYRAAALCSPHDLEALYFVADLEAQRGDLAAATSAARGFMQAAAPRRNDPIRDARRQIIESAIRRYTRQGVILLNVSCRAQICQGQAFNAGVQDAHNVTASAFSGGKKPEIVGSTTIESIPVHASRPFTIRVQGAVAKVTVGADEDELAANLTTPTP